MATITQPAIALLLLSHLTNTSWGAESAPTDSSHNYTTVTVLASVGVVGAGLTLLIVCTFAWWRRQYRKLCPLPPPEDDPVATFVDGHMGSDNDGHSYGTMRSLDVRSLESDSRVTIEPFPPLTHLTHVVSRYAVTETGDARMSFDSEDTDALHAILPHDDLPPPNEPNDWLDNEALQFPRDKISFMQEVGTGWWGLVIESEATDVLPFPRRSKVVVEVLREEATEAEQLRFLHQARLYRDSNHKNIMKLLGHSLHSTPWLLLLEHYPRGDLKSLLLHQAQTPLLLDAAGANRLNKMCLDVAQGLVWMHAQGFTHPDLAARNCLVGGEGQVVIGDYGLGRSKYRGDYYWGTGGVGGGEVGVAIRWAAPESLAVTPSTIRTLRATAEGNVWSLGVLVWEVAEGARTPYAELSDELVLSRVINDKNYSLRPPSIAALPHLLLRDRLALLITQCLHGIPDRRPTMEDVLLLLSAPF